MMRRTSTLTLIIPSTRPSLIRCSIALMMIGRRSRMVRAAVVNGSNRDLKARVIQRSSWEIASAGCRPAVKIARNCSFISYARQIPPRVRQMLARCVAWLSGKSSGFFNSAHREPLNASRIGRQGGGATVATDRGGPRPGRHRQV